MSTRATVLFKEDNNILAKVYHHFDGYPSGFGINLGEFLDQINIINGIGSEQNEMFRFANGFGCAVAQFIAKIKEGVGNVYVVAIDYDDSWIDFNYVVNFNKKEQKCYISVSMFGENERVFFGCIKEFIEFCLKVDNEEE